MKIHKIYCTTCKKDLVSEAIPVDKIIWCIYCGTELDNEKHGRILKLISINYLKDPFRAEETYSDGSKEIKEITDLSSYIMGENEK